MRVVRRFVGVAGLVGLVVGASVVVSVSPAGATTAVDETAFRAAWTNAAETQIDLGADISLTCGSGGIALRTSNSSTPMVLDGHGFTLRQTCASNGVLRSSGSQSLTVQNVTITGGQTTGVGGGVNTTGSALTINNAIITGNQAPGAGGGVSGDGGPLTINNSTFTDNHLVSLGGNGGAASSNVSITVNGSMITGNTTPASGGVGAFATGGLVRLTDTTVSGNTAPAGSAIGTGGGVELIRSSVNGNHSLAIGTGGPVTLTDSTIAHNDLGGISSPGAVTLTNSTISDNGGPGISTDSNVALTYATVTANGNGTTNGNIGSRTLNSFGSVVAQPVGGPNCEVGGTTSTGFNFSDDVTCGFTASSDRQGPVNTPQLGTLGDNGGPTATRLPLAGSPLIDAIPVVSCQSDGAAGVTTDQRLLTRPAPGAGCDIGAVEVQSAAPQPQPVVIAPRFTG